MVPTQSFNAGRSWEGAISGKTLRRNLQGYREVDGSNWNDSSLIGVRGVIVFMVIMKSGKVNTIRKKE